MLRGSVSALLLLSLTTCLAAQATYVLRYACRRCARRAKPVLEPGARVVLCWLQKKVVRACKELLSVLVMKGSLQMVVWCVRNVRVRAGCVS